MKKSFIRAIIGTVVVVVLLNLLVSNPSFNNFSDKARFEILANQHERAEGTLREMLQRDSANIDLHYQFISNHFDIPERKRVGRHQYDERDDQMISNYYESLSRSGHPRISDVGFYGKGLLAVHRSDFPTALQYFRLVKDTNLKYLNNSIGNVMEEVDSLDQAANHFRREIALGGNLSGAYFNLSYLLYRQNRYGEIEQLLEDTATSKYVPRRIEKSLHFKSGRVFRYAQTVFDRTFSGINLFGSLAALLILATWVIYLRKIDIYEAESWKHIAIAVVLGMIFSFFTDPLSDLDNLVFGFTLNGGLLNDFLYCVIGIGAIEEFVKIVPLLLMIRFSGAVNEPFDYIKYASLSALGFAFVENLIYFQETDLRIIHGRAFTAVVSHMFDSSLIAYGLVLSQYKWRRHPVPVFLLFFALAALAHGFYDFWLINESVKDFSILTLVFLVSSMIMWNSFKNNALNHSTFFDHDKAIDSRRLQDFLVYSLTGILLFEYTVQVIQFGPTVGNSGLVSSLQSGTYLIFFLSTNLSKFTHRQAYWAPVKFWIEKKNQYDELVQRRVRLWLLTNNENARRFLPNAGIVARRVTVSDEPEWYIVKLEEKVTSQHYLGDAVFIRSKDKEPLLVDTPEGQVAFFLVPKGVDLSKQTFKRTEIKFCGWAGIG